MVSSVSQKGLGGFVDYLVLEKTGPSPIFWNDFVVFWYQKGVGPRRIIHPGFVDFASGSNDTGRFSRRYTDEHGSFSFVSETRKAEEEVSTSSFAFPASEANEKLSC